MEIEEIRPENEQSQESKPILAETLESIKKSQDIAAIDPYELLGFTFVKEHKGKQMKAKVQEIIDCLLYTSPSPRDGATSRMPSSA